jgi:acyl dehydratase
MRYFEDYQISEQTDIGSYLLTKTEIIEFASKWDPQPIHVDESAAKNSIERTPSKEIEFAFFK